jgi:Flp pilus assembly protein TadG
VKRLMGERGQVLPIVGLAMVLLLGGGALAIDYGSYYHAQRQLQSDVDAAALAAAQDLPAVTGQPVSVAQATATRVYSANLSANFDSQRASTPAPTFPAPTGTNCTASNCIAIDGNTTINSIFGKALGSAFGLYYVHAHAQAYVGPPGTIKNLSAAAIDQTQFNTATGCPTTCNFPSGTVTLKFDTASNGFSLLDLTSSSSTPVAGGSVSTNQMGLWLRVGDTDALPVNVWYGATTGLHTGLAQFFCDTPGNEPTTPNPPCPLNYNSNTTVMVLPVFDKHCPNATLPACTGYTGTDTYHVIGFAGFIITQSVNGQGGTWKPGSEQLTGHFVSYIASGLPAGPGSGQNLGVFVVGING